MQRWVGPRMADFKWAGILAAALLSACAPQTNVVSDYKAELNRPPLPGVAPDGALVELATRSSSAFTMFATAAALQTATEQLAENRYFLFLVSGEKVGADRFNAVVDAICEHTGVYLAATTEDQGSADQIGLFPLTIVPVQGEEVTARYNVRKAISWNSALLQTDKRDLVEDLSGSIGFLLVEEAALYGKIANIRDGVSGNQFRTAFQEELAAIENGYYFPLRHTNPKHISEYVNPIVTLGNHTTEPADLERMLASAAIKDKSRGFSQGEVASDMVLSQCQWGG